MSEKITISLQDYVLHGLFFNIYGVFKYMPSPLGDVFRSGVVRIFLKKMGSIRIYDGVTIWYPYRVSVGKHCTFNEFVYINGFGGITIGDGVRIGHRTSILSSDHVITDANTPIKDSGLTAKPVNIADDVFIGCNVTILQGVTIGKGAVIAAGALVNRDVPPYSIAGGVPAKVIGSRHSKTDI